MPYIRKAVTALVNEKIEAINSGLSTKLTKLKVGNFTFPIFENTKALKLGDKLCALDPSAAAKKARV